MSARLSEVNDRAYLQACERVEEEVNRLASARGIVVRLEVDPARTPSELIADAHQIQLTYGRSTRNVPVDHEAFMNEEFFRSLVLHQLQTVIEELASTVDLRPMWGRHAS